MTADVPDDITTFCAREYPRLVGALGLYLGDVHVAEELAQEALVRACQRWRRVRALESPGGWTYRVAMNLATSHLRRSAAERRANARVVARGGVAVAVSAEGAVDDRESVRALLAALPPKERAVLVLRYYLDQSADEVGAHLQMSAGAVRVLAKRTLDALRATAADVTPEGVADVS